MSSRAFNIADHMKNLQGTRTLASGAKIVGADADSIQAPGLITSAGGGDNTSINSAIGSATGATFNGTVGSSATFPAGHVLQIVQHVTSTKIVNTTNPADVDLMEKAITPKKNTSKILVMLVWYEGNSNPNGAYRLMRDGTSIVNSWTNVSGGSGTGFISMDDFPVPNSYSMASMNFTYLDSPTIPTTPIAITYKLGTHSSSSVYFNTQIDDSSSVGGTSTITLWELAG